MGKESGNAPATPDPQKLIGLQSAADKSAFNYTTDANRYNTYGPDATQTWNKNSVVDQTGYDRAIESWKASNPQGKWVEGSAATPGGTYNSITGEVSAGTPAGVGHWEGAQGDGNLAPTLDQFTTNKYDLTTKLSPEQQKLHDLNQSSQTGQAGLLDALTQRLKGTYSSPWNNSGAPDLVGGVKAANLQNPQGFDPKTLQGITNKIGALDPTQINQNASDAAYRVNTRYLDPQNESQQKALESRLSEQGFVPGTPGYDQAMKGFQDTSARSYADARDRSYLAGQSSGSSQFSSLLDALKTQFNQGSSIQDRSRQTGLDANTVSQQLFNNDKDSGAFQNTARNQAIAESLQQRQQPLNELNAIRSGTQQNTPGGPGGSPIPQGGVGPVGSTDVMGAYNQQYKAMMDKYNADVNSGNSDTQAGVGIISALAIAY